LDDHFELQRQVEENRALEDKNKTLVQKVDELLTVNRKMCNQLETIKVTLSTLVENVSELKNHVTSNKLCRYIIVLYKDEEHSDEKFIVIKPFCGLKENRPKIDKSDILFEREVSCSIDSFKEALSALEERYIVKIHYRSMTIRRPNLEAFIDEFRVELRRRSTTITDVCDRLDTINDNISTLDSKVTSIDKRLAAYDKFIANYGTDYAFVKRVLDGEVTCKNKGKLYQLQLSMKKQQPYIDVNGYRLYMPLNVFHKRYL
jgi:archaellum component FlaC